MQVTLEHSDRMRLSPLETAPANQAQSTRKSYVSSRLRLAQVALRLNFDFSFVWLLLAAAAVIASLVLVLRDWKALSLPLRLIPADVLTVVLLIDLNLKSNSNLTDIDPVVKIEAAASTVLLTFVLFAPVVWKLVHRDRKAGSRKDTD
jgi:hypothetical protein